MGVLTTVSAGALVFFVVAYFLRVAELHDLAQVLRRKILKRYVTPTSDVNCERAADRTNVDAARL